MVRESYRIGDLILDVGAVRITRGDEVIALPGLSFDLLVALARHAPNAVNADRLIETVWRGTSVSDETLTQRVALLRRALGDDAKSPRYVRSIRGHGYGLIPDAVAVTAAPVVRRRWPWALVAAALLTLIGWLTLDDHPGGAAPRQPIRTAPSSADELVARADDYLKRHQQADNELAIELYRRALEIYPNHLPAAVGLSLGLSQRVTKFNRHVEDAAEALALAERAIEKESDNAAAHHARALALDSRGHVSPALAGYRRAWKLDSGRVGALSNIAYLSMIQGRLADALQTNLQVAGAAPLPVYHELQIGSTLAELGFETVAEVWLERANELRPNSVFAAGTYARFRLGQGRLSDAEALAHAALARGIERPELHTILGHVALLRGHQPKAALHYRAAHAINPRRGYAEKRLLVLERWTEPENETLEARYREAAEASVAARLAGNEWPPSAIDEAVLHAGFGQSDAALAALDSGIELGYRNADWLLLDPLLEHLRRDPRFHQRIEQMRLAIARERERVLAASWLPDGLLRTHPAEDKSPNERFRR